MVMPMAVRGAQSGTSMIEVLVTIVIIAFGLLGMAGLQSRMQVSEVEAYQRAQALLLLNDMSNRIATNRSAAASYVTASAVGAGSNCAADFAGAAIPVVDKREWCLALQGAAELEGASKLGAVIGGRGCVEDLGSGEYMITIAWQGMVPLAAPVGSVACGAGLYNGTTGAQCTNDLCRRVVTTIVRIASLT
jgi:type IV pilus assembly protein PilV